MINFRRTKSLYFLKFNLYWAGPPTLFIPESCYKWDKADQAPWYVVVLSNTSTYCYRAMVPSVAWTSCPLWYHLFTFFLKVLINLENTLKYRRSNFTGIDLSTPGFIHSNTFRQAFRVLSLDFCCIQFLVVQALSITSWVFKP